MDELQKKINELKNTLKRLEISCAELKHYIKYEKIYNAKTWKEIA